MFLDQIRTSSVPFHDGGGSKIEDRQYYNIVISLIINTIKEQTYNFILFEHEKS